MEPNTEHYPLKTELTLKDRSQSPLIVRVINLTLIKLENEVIECHLTLLVNPELYLRIDSEALFNLKPEVRSPLSGGNFLPENDIQIEIGLQPSLLSPPLEQAIDAMEAVTYILNLNQEHPENQLLSSESWLALSVKQLQATGETGYSTIWANITPSTFAQVATSTSSEQFAEVIDNLTKNWTNSSFSETSENSINQTLESMTHSFEELAENISEMAQTMISEAVEEVNNVLENLAEDIFETTDEVTTNETIFATIVNFFKKFGWLFSQFAEEPILYITYQGKNGRWNCSAKAREQQQQFVFYSVCPVTAPESQRQAIAEFITIANYDMIIGNFELDFRDGEIRYKTSIDVEGDRLSFAGINNLVYANVNMMDKYLPGIMSVIAGEVIPTSAINQIEIIPNIPQGPQEPEQPLVVTPADKPEKLAVHSTSPPEIQQQEENIPERQSHILARLTPNEIGQLHQALQMLEPYQRKQTQEIIEKVKRLIITRLGDLGTEVFDEALAFFTKVKFPVIILKLIQRYAKMAGRTRLFIEQLKDRVKQYREPFDTSEINLAVEDLEKLFAKIDKRLEELPTDKLLGDKELIHLLEIEQFNEQLAFFERLIKNIFMPSNDY